MSDNKLAKAIAPGSIRRHVIVGVGVVALFVGGFVSWAATVPLAGAVIAPGLIVVDSNVKTVQHLSGGIVGEILVRDGATVTENQVVMRLDDTVPRATLSMIVKQLTELTSRLARLEAERDGAEAIVFPPEYDDVAPLSDAGRAKTGEVALFEARRNARSGLRKQLTERMAQTREEIVGLRAQEAARRRQSQLIAREVVDVESLFQRNLVPRTRLVELQREEARLQGEIGQFVAERARAEGRIAETELQILQIDQDLRREVSQEMREVQARIGEFVERRIAAEDQLRRVDIRAPQAGVVHQMVYHTVGGVVQAGQPIMQIVPGADSLVVEVRVMPTDIDQVAVGQAVFVRLSAFPQQTTPELNGVVTRVAADASREQQTGLTYYIGRVSFNEGELARLGAQKLVPGMPAEAFVRTGDRTAIAYLMRPLMDQIKRTFREN